MLCYATVVIIHALHAHWYLQTAQVVIQQQIFVIQVEIYACAWPIIMKFMLNRAQVVLLLVKTAQSIQTIALLVIQIVIY